MLLGGVPPSLPNGRAPLGVPVNMASGRTVHAGPRRRPPSAPQCPPAGLLLGHSLLDKERRVFTFYFKSPLKKRQALCPVLPASFWLTGLSISWFVPSPLRGQGANSMGSTPDSSPSSLLGGRPGPLNVWPLAHSLTVPRDRTFSSEGPGSSAQSTGDLAPVGAGVGWKCPRG